MKDIELFCKVPNGLIKDSINKQRLLLPLFLYSWVNQQYYNDNLVVTNIDILTETMSGAKKENGMHDKIKEALKMLSNEREEEYNNSNKLVNSGYPQSIQYKYDYTDKDLITRPRIQYYFLSRDEYDTSNFTIITFKEYYILSNYVEEQNYNTGKKILSFPILLNLYVYMKMRINQYDFYSEYYNNQDIYMKENLLTISKKMNMGNKTVSKYLKILIDLNMLYTKNGKNSPSNSINHWKLSDKWKNS